MNQMSIRVFKAGDDQYTIEVIGPRRFWWGRTTRSVTVSREEWREIHSEICSSVAWYFGAYDNLLYERIRREIYQQFNALLNRERGQAV